MGGGDKLTASDIGHAFGAAGKGVVYAVAGFVGLYALGHMLLFLVSDAHADTITTPATLGQQDRTIMGHVIHSERSMRTTPLKGAGISSDVAILRVKQRIVILEERARYLRTEVLPLMEKAREYRLSMEPIDE